MPVYDCRNEDTIKDVWPSRVFDANGVEIEDVVYCDTDTGRVGLVTLAATLKESPLILWEDRPAPLRLVKIDGPAEPVAAPAVRPPEGNDGCAVALFGLTLALAALAYSWPAWR
ncbi:unnamed protein product [Gemmata massiliana]|uniref:Uncharacterized protein n=1 Tax=Gemmata massiliana TaxID=1210884 RepID=A0A6P2DL74_9BACT|nr:hypothetical protein [Gemmata massiliana]VTS03539.1 unnamed protein product [Gemmata massiliana]